MRPKQNKYYIEFIQRSKLGVVSMGDDIVKSNVDLFEVTNFKELEKRYANVKDLKSIAICNVTLIN